MRSVVWAFEIFLGTRRILERRSRGRKATRRRVHLPGDEAATDLFAHVPILHNLPVQYIN